MKLKNINLIVFFILLFYTTWVNSNRIIDRQVGETDVTSGNVPQPSLNQDPPATDPVVSPVQPENPVESQEPVKTSDPVVNPTPSVPVSQPTTQPNVPIIPTTTQNIPVIPTSNTTEQPIGDKTTPIGGSTNTNTNSDGNNNNNNNNNHNDDDDEDDGGGVSGATIGIIIGGCVLAAILLLMIFTVIRKISKKKEYSSPIPIMNVVSNSSSTQQLNNNNDQYYQSQNELPTTQYYPQTSPSQQPQNYQNPGTVDIVNSGSQYRQDSIGSAIGINAAAATAVNASMVNDYTIPPRPEQIVQPVRQNSSLRRPKRTATNNMVNNENKFTDNVVVPVEGENDDYNNVAVAPAKPHKVIINHTNNTPIEPGTIHKTQFPFIPNMDDELRLNPGDAVEIIEVYDDGWSYGKNVATNEVGVFPISYITGYNDPDNNF